MVNRAFPLALGLALLVGCAPPKERAETARAAIQRALERGDRPAALAALEDLHEALPESPDSLLQLARTSVLVGSAPDALWMLEAGVRRYPERGDLRVALARVALLLANPTLAREAVASVEAGSDEHPAALLARAQAELKLGDLGAALEVLEEARTLYPDRPEAAVAQINTLLQERRHDEARAAIERLHASLAEYDDAPELQRRLELSLAQLRAQQGEPEAALASLDALLEDDPYDPELWQALVQVLLQQSRADDAVDRLERALEDDEADPELYPVVARLHEGLGDTAAAEAALRDYIDASFSAAAYVPLVLHYSNQDQPPAAVALLEEAIARFPEEASLRLLHFEMRLAAGDVDAARHAARAYGKASFDGDPQNEYLLARLELADDQPDAAVARLTKLAPHLDRAATQYWLGRALQAQGRIDGARRRYALAERRDPTWGAPTAELFAIARDRGDWRSMVGHARVLTRVAPRRMESWASLVDALVLYGDAEGALEAARRCLKIFPDAPESQLLLARAERAGGRYDAALAAFAAAEPDGETALAADRVHTLGLAGRLDEGIALAQRVLETEPERADVYASLAALLYAQGASEDGDRATDRALALSPESLQPLRTRCEFRAATGRWPGALEDCQRYLEARPEDAGAYFMLGLTQAALGDAGSAIASYERAAALDETDFRPRNNVAELLAGRGDLDAALAQAQEAYRLAPDDPNVSDTLGALYLRKRLPERAVVLLERAHSAAPEAHRTTFHLALAYRDAGRPDDARGLLAALQREEDTDVALRSEVEEALHSLP